MEGRLAKKSSDPETTTTVMRNPKESLAKQWFLVTGEKTQMTIAHVRNTESIPHSQKTLGRQAFEHQLAGSRKGLAKKLKSMNLV